MNGLSLLLLTVFGLACFIAGVLFGRRNIKKVEMGVSKAKEYIDKAKQ